MSPANTNSHNDKPTTYRAWVIWRIRRSPTRTLAGLEEVCGPLIEDYVRTTLRAMRDEGLIACTSRRWWQRPAKLKCKKK